MKIQSLSTFLNAKRKQSEGQSTKYFWSFLAKCKKKNNWGKKKKKVKWLHSTRPILWDLTFIWKDLIYPLFRLNSSL